MALESAETAAEKADTIRGMFSRIAPRYDLLNGLLSLGLDRRWRSEAARVALEPAPAAVLDVATGTGDLAFALKRRAPAAAVTGVDFAAPMLERARRKALARGLDVDFVPGDGADLPFENETFGAVTVAYGLRNFTDGKAGLEEFHRVLAPGGRLVVLEFTDPGPGLVGNAVRLYCKTIVPLVGGTISGRRNAYRYLPASIDAFAPAEDLARQLADAGFLEVRYRRQAPGISALHVGDKAP